MNSLQGWFQNCFYDLNCLSLSEDFKILPIEWFNNTYYRNMWFLYFSLW